MSLAGSPVKGGSGCLLKDSPNEAGGSLGGGSLAAEVRKFSVASVFIDVGVRQVAGLRLQGVGFLVNEAEEKVYCLQPIAEGKEFSRGQVAHYANRSRSVGVRQSTSGVEKDQLRPRLQIGSVRRVCFEAGRIEDLYPSGFHVVVD